MSALRGEREGWRDGAACAGQPLHWWFPDGDELRAASRRRDADGNRDDPYRKARAVCVACPVLEDCLRYVLLEPQEFGMFAALNPEQRVRMYRERGQHQRSAADIVDLPSHQAWRDGAACGTEAGYKRHWNARESACDRCRQAVRDRDRAKRAERAERAS